MEIIDRRQFMQHSIQRAAQMSLGLAALSTAARPILGANERVNLALIGCGGRGRAVARGFIECGARIAWVCDLNQERLDALASEFEQAQGTKPRQTKAIKTVLDAKDVDAVIVATPDHWHTPAAIMACQAGKDVYVEKPPSYDLWESRKLIEAVRKYNRVLQVGTQNRSAPYNRAALDYVKSGKLGGIHLVKVYNLKSGGAFGLGAPGTPPAGFDWNAWLGPAPQRPYHQHIFQGGWHKFWDFSGGDMADDGIHQLDLASMLMGDPGMPAAVSCSGGRLAYKDDDSEVPDTQAVTFDFPEFVMTFELTGYPRYMQKTTGTIRRNDEFPYWTQNATRIELYGAERMMTIGRHGGGWIVTTSGGRIVDKMFGRPPDQLHETNFLDCIKTRQRTNADIETLHHSAALIHLGNIAHRVGNLKLRFDPQAERFRDNADANGLLRRNYRTAYTVPDSV